MSAPYSIPEQVKQSLAALADDARGRGRFTVERNLRNLARDIDDETARKLRQHFKR